MNLAKRIRVESDESDEPNNHRSKDHSVCDPCRVKKIRCGREKPYCSNCSRLGQECSYHGQGKKPSVTTALNYTVKDHESRLQSLEGSLSEIQESLVELHMTRLPSPSTLPCPSLTDLSSKFSTVSTITNKFSRIPTRCPGRRHTVHSRESCERYTGPTSLQSLILDVQEFVVQPLYDESKSQQSVVAIRDSLNELLDFSIGGDSISDDSPPALPPLAMLEAMMELYFDSVSPRLPIWSYEAFRRLVYPSKTSGDASMDRISGVSCNNMILLTLTSKFLQSESRKHRHSLTEKHSLSSMELEIVKPFLINAKRAMNKIEQFLSPSLTNVQAFLSLCLVAQQYLTDNIFSFAYHQAVYLARSIGLEYSQLSAGNPSPEHLQERRLVLDCLCILGTSVSWMTGFHSGFVTSETTAALGSQELSSDKNWRGKLKLAQLQDQIFLTLYSPGSQSKMVHEIQSAVSSLKHQLEYWWNECGESANTEPTEPAQVERAISYYSIRVLLAWPIPKVEKDSQGVLDDSRSCLKSFIRAWEMEANLGHHGYIARLLISYPPVAFVQLFAGCINSINAPSRAEDVKTLQAFVSIIETVSNVSEAKSYTTRLYIFTQTMTNFAAAYIPSPLHEPFIIQPERLRTSLSTSDKISSGSFILNAAENSETLYQELETIDSFHQSANSPLMLNMPHFDDEFFATQLAGL